MAPLTTLLEEVQAQQMGALFHLGTASATWAAGSTWAGCGAGRQPSRITSVSLPPAEGYRVLVAVPIWKLELFNQDPGRLHRFVGEVVERLPFTRDWAAPMRWSWVQPGCSKQPAGPSGPRGRIAMENLVAFGDNNNDISMFEQVGLAVAMGNAAP